MIKKVLVWVVSLTLVLNGYLAIAAAPDIVAEEVDPVEIITRLDDLLVSFDRLRAEVDRSQFDLDSLLDDLAYDADEIVRFVSDEIYFEQYPGVLRGAKGTLISRSGNAVDQALLLSTLLKDAGFDARIVRGELSTADARVLLSGMRAPEQLPPFRDADAFAKIVAQVGPPGGNVSVDEFMQSLLDTGEHQRQVIREEYGSDARQISTRLLEEIRKARGSGSWSEDLPITEAQDYFWVQSRLDTNSWVDLHPAWDDERVGPPSAAVSATYSDQVPTELVQKVELLVTGERAIGKKLESVTLLKMEPTPAANLISVPLSLMFVPLGDYKTLEDLAGVLSQTELFVPMLNQAPGEYVVDLRGNFVPAAEAQTAMAGVFREAGRAFSEAAGALDSLDRPAEEVRRSMTALTGMWLDFRIHLPNGQIREHRRTVIDGVSGDRDSDQWSLEDHSMDDLREMLLGTRHTLLETGRGSTAFRLDQTLAYAQELAKFYKDWVSNKQGIAGAAEPEPPPIISPSMHLALFDVFDQIKTEDPTVVVYRSEPSLVTIEYKGKTSESGEVVSQTTVDVVSNKRRLYVRRDGEIVPSGDDTVFLGVMETLAEGSIFPEDAAPSWNAGRTTLAALDNRRSFTVLKPNSRDTIDELPISAVSARAMHRELDQGYWIVAPEMPENAALEDHVWWRIQPETGNALGMIHTGQGASAVQTAILRMVIFSVAYLLIVKPICSNAFSGTAATVCAKLGIGGTAVGTVAATTEGTALGVNAVRFAAFNWAVAAVLIFAIAGLSYLLYADSEIRQKNVISIEDRFAKRHLGDYRNRSS